MKYSILLLVFLTASLLLSGCVSSPPSDDDTIAPKIIKQFFEKPQDPRRFGLTVYQSKYGPVFSGSKRLHDFQTAKAGFVSWRSEMPLVHCQSRKLQLVTALVDTSSRDSWITLDAASRLAATPMGPPPYRRQADHVAEAEPGIAAYISKLRVEDLHIENMVAYVRVPKITLGHIGRQLDDPKPEMVLGCDLLSQFSFVRFDFPERCVYFSVDQKYAGNEDLTIETAPFKKIYGTPAVDAVLNGTPVKLVIDTCGDFEVAWNKPDGSVIQQLSIGDLVLRDVVITNADDLPLGYSEVPRIGNRLLRRFAVTMDNKRRLIIFERPAARSTIDFLMPDEDEKNKPDPKSWIPE